MRSSAASRAALEMTLAAISIALVFGIGLILPMPFWHAQPAAPASTPDQTAVGLGWPGALLAIGFALALCVPFRPYALALRAASRVSTRTLVALTAFLALVGLLIYPGFGSDLFVYLDYERLWVVYGANPLLAFPALHPEDWAYHFVWIPQQPSPYGPLWPLVTWPIARLAGDSLLGWIAGYKLLSIGSYVFCCALVWASVDSDRRKRALVLFAWSPLVLFEVLGKAHNDGLLAVAALATVWLARRHPVIAMVAATAGMLVKLSGLAVVLGLVLALAHARAWKPLGLAVAAAGVLTIAAYAPFWTGPATLLPVLVQTSRVVWSPGALLISGLGWLPSVDVLARFVAAAGWACVCALVARRQGVLARDTAVLLIGTLLLLTTAFFAHYLVPVVGLAAIAGSQRLERMTLALSVGSLAAYSVELLGAAMPAGWVGSAGFQALGSVLTLAPATALLLWWTVPAVLRKPSRRGVPPLAGLVGHTTHTAAGSHS